MDSILIVIKVNFTFMIYYNFLFFYQRSLIGFIYMNIALVILVLNERECLEIVFPKIPKIGATLAYDQIFAIDGGSTDGTKEFLESKGLQVIHQEGLGKGRGSAFHLAISKISADAYIFFSPDGNESIEDLTRFREYLNDGADIVIASRMMTESVNEEDKNIIKLRKWANLTFNWLANLIFLKKGSKITDSINGYRAITKDAFIKLNLDSKDYTIEYQMTIRALRSSMNIIEFPTIEGERVAGKTGAPSIPTGLRFLRLLLKECFIHLQKGN